MRLTRRFLLGATTASFAASAFARPPTTYRLPALATLRQAIGIAAAKAISTQGAPGIAVAIGRGNRLLFEEGHGTANLETGTVVGSTGIFRIGSLTKQFTAAAAARLSELGRFKLTDPVAAYLPAFAALPAVSIAELIHHTAGLHSDEESVSRPAGTEGPSSQVALAKAIAAQAKLFDFAPGTAWLYSNGNYIVLGAIIEQVFGQPFAQAMEALVLNPLGRSTLALDRGDSVVPWRVSGYSLDQSGEDYLHAPYVEISDAGGAGAMRGSAADLVRWHQALLGGRIVGSESLAFLLAPGRLRDGRLGGANRFSPGDANYGEVQYGGGLLLSPASSKPRTISHNGFINGFSAVLETNLDTGVTFAALANADVGPNLPFRDIRRAVRAFEGIAGRSSRS